jgi:predicted solute-binding protein
MKTCLRERMRALVIGDPAMRVEAIAGRLGLTIHDLAAEWRRD